MVIGVLWIASASLGGEMTFDCQSAPVLLGHADATIVSCDRVLDTENLWFVWLSTSAGDVHRLVLVDRDPPYVGTGLAAMGRYLEESGLDRDRKLKEYNLRWFLKAAEGYPPGWSAADGGGSFPEVGPSTVFSANPLVFTMYRRIEVRPPEGGKSGAGIRPPGQALPIERAVLTRGADGWAWTLATRTATGWSETARVALR